jgi:RNA polymerase sigma factor (sigma-70 family)
MHEPDDSELLAQYARNQSEEAFVALVSRHVNMVYSVALRHVSNLHEAEDITQVVFLLLARKAGSLSPKTVLSGWLYRTAQLTAANYCRMEKRRQRREQEAYMQSLAHESEPEVWTKIAPALDVAMARLGDKERNAVILRFFEGKSLKEIGSALGASEDAAQKNVERGLKNLHRHTSAEAGPTSWTEIMNKLYATTPTPSQSIPRQKPPTSIAVKSTTWREITTEPSPISIRPSNSMWEDPFLILIAV